LKNIKRQITRSRLVCTFHFGYNYTVYTLYYMLTGAHLQINLKQTIAKISPVGFLLIQFQTFPN